MNDNTAASSDNNDSKYAMGLRDILVSPCIQGPSMFFSNADNTVKFSLCAAMFTGMLDEKYLDGGERTTDYLTLQAEITAPLGTKDQELAKYVTSVLDFCTDSALTTKVQLHIKDMSHIETKETQAEWKAAGELHRLVHIHCKVSAEYYEICAIGERAVSLFVEKSTGIGADRLALHGIIGSLTRH
jgi:hypothetical protein